MILPRDIPKFSRNFRYVGAENYGFVHYIQKHQLFKQEVLFEHNVLIIILEGSKIIKTSHTEYRINPNEAIFIPKNHYVLSEILDINKKQYSSLLFFFPDQLIHNFIAKYHLSFQELTKKREVFLVKTDKILNSLFEGFLALMDGVSQTQLLLLKYEEIFLYLLEDKKNRQKFLDFLSHFSGIQTHRSTDLLPDFYENVTIMAKNAKMHQASFSRKFKKELGLSPKKWLDDKRFERAQFLLEFSSKNITEISQELGFNSPAWFIDRFKKRFGVTPKQYQKSKNLYFVS